MASTGTATEPRTVLRLCGGVELEIAGRSVAGALPSGQATALLAYLAISEAPLGRDELIDALWPLGSPTDPQAVLSTLLSRLRRVLGSEALAGRRQLELRLPQPVWFDVQAAGDAVEEAREALAASAWSRLLERCRLALDILGRSFLPGHEAPWIDACRRDLEDLHLAALELEARGGLAVGEGGLERAARAARTLIAMAPYHEVGYRRALQGHEATLSQCGGSRQRFSLRVHPELSPQPPALTLDLSLRCSGPEAQPLGLRAARTARRDQQDGDRERQDAGPAHAPGV